MRTFAETRGGVSLALDVERVELETKRTVPLGLMVNELLTNALKYAYPGPAGGEIRVRLARTGDRLRVVVQDDGAGLPERFDPETSGGMGTLLVRMLAAQIGATVSFGATRAAPQGGLGPGTTVAIELAP
jgi:two-component sensor histidine kinase